MDRAGSKEEGAMEPQHWGISPYSTVKEEVKVKAMGSRLAFSPVVAPRGRINFSSAGSGPCQAGSSPWLSRLTTIRAKLL